MANRFTDMSNNQIRAEMDRCKSAIRQAGAGSAIAAYELYDAAQELKRRGHDVR